MNERLLTQTFDKIKKQYIAIQNTINNSNKPDRTNLSIELYGKFTLGLIQI